MTLSWSCSLPTSALSIALYVVYAVPAGADERSFISEKEVQTIVYENTSSPAAIVDQKWIDADNEIEIKNIELGLSEEVILPDQAGLPIVSEETLVRVIDREDGTQIATVSLGEVAQEFRFSFAGSYLEMKDGYVLVRPDQFAEPEKIIDPAWVQDTAGNEVNTFFEVDGDTLIQHVDKSVNGAPVVALGSGYCAGKV